MVHIPVSTGSLGLGLAWGVGRAIGLEREGSSRRVIVIMSDGELQAGLSFEAILLAARERPALLTILVDSNGWQTDGPVRIDPPGILRGIGVSVQVIDGHSSDEIGEALAYYASTGPAAIVARTQRCAGLPDRYRRGPELYGEQITEVDAEVLTAAVDRRVVEK
jgi:transketolase